MPGKNFPEYVFFAYQMMFAIITPALITGAFINRVSFKAYVFFLIFWQIFVLLSLRTYGLGAEEFIQQWGVLDFAGGIVVHATAGFAALVATIYVGKKKREANMNPITSRWLLSGLLCCGLDGMDSMRAANST